METKTIELGKNVTLEMVSIPAGSFMMGSPEDEKGRFSDEGPQHEVRVPEFWMAKYPITQAQWRAGATLPKLERALNPDPSFFKGDNRPVEQVNWYEALEFCDRLSAHTKQLYTLPSEAQWEYACRAGTTTPFHFGDTITPDLVNYNGNYSYGSGPKGIYREATTAVGSFPPNGFGLYDMQGNVFEWCLDYWHDDYNHAPANGTAWVTGEYNYRIRRGGSWYGYPKTCRCAYRNASYPDCRSYVIGFRVVSVPPRVIK